MPIAISGLMLGLSGLGALLQEYGEWIHILCGILAAFILVLLILKLCLDGKSVRDSLNSPALLGIGATFPMACMMLSTYIRPYAGIFAAALWWAALMLHLVLILLFTKRFILHFHLENIYTSAFIVYVGIVMASVTAPAYGMESVGTWIFWFGFVCLILLFPVVTVRYLKIPQPDPLKPMICIYSAPVSLCIAGYLQSVQNKAAGFLICLMIVSSVLYVMALCFGIRFLRGTFYPSFSAFTFPFVITATAAKQSMLYLISAGCNAAFLRPVVIVETAVAVFFVAYVFVRYLIFVTADV